MYVTFKFQRIGLENLSACKSVPTIPRCTPYQCSVTLYPRDLVFVRQTDGNERKEHFQLLFGMSGGALFEKLMELKENIYFWI